ncbi:MAG: metalloregulator ArsR/SmtB family transcription factor [Desulfotalea sp.]
MQNAHLEIVAQLFKAMGHPLRLAILYSILDEEKNTGTLAAELQTTKPNLSQHLNILRDHGLITSRKEKTFIKNGIADKRIATILHNVKISFHIT